MLHNFHPQIRRGDPPSGAGVPVHRQVRRGVPRQLEAWREDHQARHQSCPGILRRRQLITLYTKPRRRG